MTFFLKSIKNEQLHSRIRVFDVEYVTGIEWFRGKNAYTRHGSAYFIV
jgi:hypothetical protein